MSKLTSAKKIAILKEKIINVSLLIEKYKDTTAKLEELIKERNKYFKWLKKVYVEYQKAEEKTERLASTLAEYSAVNDNAKKSLQEREIRIVQLEQVINVYKIERESYGVEKIDRLQRKVNQLVDLHIKSAKSVSNKSERFPQWFLDEFGESIKKLKKIKKERERDNFFNASSPSWSQQSSVDSGYSGSIASESLTLQSPPLKMDHLSEIKLGEENIPEITPRASPSGDSVPCFVVRQEECNGDEPIKFVVEAAQPEENQFEIVYTFNLQSQNRTDSSTESGSALTGTVCSADPSQNSGNVNSAGDIDFGFSSESDVENQISCDNPALPVVNGEIAAVHASLVNAQPYSKDEISKDTCITESDCLDDEQQVILNNVSDVASNNKNLESIASLNLCQVDIQRSENLLQKTIEGDDNVIASIVTEYQTEMTANNQSMPIANNSVIAAKCLDDGELLISKGNIAVTPPSIKPADNGCEAATVTVEAASIILQATKGSDELMENICQDVTAVQISEPSVQLCTEENINPIGKSHNAETIIPVDDVLNNDEATFCKRRKVDQKVDGSVHEVTFPAKSLKAKNITDQYYKETSVEFEPDEDSILNEDIDSIFKNSILRNYKMLSPVLPTNFQKGDNLNKTVGNISRSPLSPSFCRPANRNTHISNGKNILACVNNLPSSNPAFQTNPGNSLLPPITTLLPRIVSFDEQSAASMSTNPEAMTSLFSPPPARKAIEAAPAPCRPDITQMSAVTLGNIHNKPINGKVTNKTSPLPVDSEQVQIRSETDRDSITIGDHSAPTNRSPIIEAVTRKPMPVTSKMNEKAKLLLPFNDPVWQRLFLKQLAKTRIKKKYPKKSKWIVEDLLANKIHGTRKVRGKRLKRIKSNMKHSAETNDVTNTDQVKSELPTSVHHTTHAIASESSAQTLTQNSCVSKTAHFTVKDSSPNKKIQNVPFDAKKHLRMMEAEYRHAKLLKELIKAKPAERVFVHKYYKLGKCDTEQQVKGAIVEISTEPQVKGAIVEISTEPQVKGAIVEISTEPQVKGAIAEISLENDTLPKALPHCNSKDPMQVEMSTKPQAFGFGVEENSSSTNTSISNAPSPQQQSELLQEAEAVSAYYNPGATRSSMRQLAAKLCNQQKGAQAITTTEGLKLTGYPSTAITGECKEIVKTSGRKRLSLSKETKNQEMKKKLRRTSDVSPTLNVHTRNQKNLPIGVRKSIRQSRSIDPSELSQVTLGDDNVSCNVRRSSRVKVPSCRLSDLVVRSKTPDNADHGSIENSVNSVIPNARKSLRKSNRLNSSSSPADLVPSQSQKSSPVLRSKRQRVSGSVTEKRGLSLLNEHGTYSDDTCSPRRSSRKKIMNPSKKLGLEQSQAPSVSALPSNTFTNESYPTVSIPEFKSPDDIILVDQFDSQLRSDELSISDRSNSPLTENIYDDKEPQAQRAKSRMFELFGGNNSVSSDVDESDSSISNDLVIDAPKIISPKTRTVASDKPTALPKEPTDLRQNISLNSHGERKSIENTTLAVLMGVHGSNKVQGEDVGVKVSGGLNGSRWMSKGEMKLFSDKPSLEPEFTSKAAILAASALNMFETNSHVTQDISSNACLMNCSSNAAAAPPKNYFIEGSSTCMFEGSKSKIDESRSFLEGNGVTVPKYYTECSNVTGESEPNLKVNANNSFVEANDTTPKSFNCLIESSNGSSVDEPKERVDASNRFLQARDVARSPPITFRCSKKKPITCMSKGMKTRTFQRQVSNTTESSAETILSAPTAMPCNLKKPSSAEVSEQPNPSVRVVPEVPMFPPVLEPYHPKRFISQQKQSLPPSQQVPSLNKQPASFLDEILDAMKRQDQEMKCPEPVHSQMVEKIPLIKKKKKSRKRKGQIQKKEVPIAREDLPAINFSNKHLKKTWNVLENFLLAENVTTEDAANSLKKCLQALKPISDDTLAKCIVILVADNVDEQLDLSFTPPAPPLTPTQHRLFTLFSAAPRFQSILPLLLSEIRTKLIEKRFFWADDTVDSCARFYSAICRRMNDRHTAIWLCFDALTQLSQRGHIIVHSVLETWSELLPKADLVKPYSLHSTLAYLILQVTPNSRKEQEIRRMKLRQLVMDILGYKCEETKDNYTRGVMAGYERNEPGTKNSLIVMSKKFGWQWSSTRIVLPLLDKFAKLEPEHSERLVSLLKKILSSFPRTNEKAKIFVKKVVARLFEILYSGNADLTVEEEIVNIVLSLCVFVPVHKELDPWIQSHTLSKELEVALNKSLSSLPQGRNLRKRKNGIKQKKKARKNK